VPAWLPAAAADPTPEIATPTDHDGRDCARDGAKTLRPLPAVHFTDDVHIPASHGSHRVRGLCSSGLQRRRRAASRSTPRCSSTADPLASQATLRRRISLSARCPLFAQRPVIDSCANAVLQTFPAHWARLHRAPAPTGSRTSDPERSGRSPPAAGSLLMPL